MDPQQAVEAPRWYSFPSTDPEHAGKPLVVRIEDRFASGVHAPRYRVGGGNPGGNAGSGGGGSAGGVARCWARGWAGVFMGPPQ